MTTSTATVAAACAGCHAKKAPRTAASQQCKRTGSGVEPSRGPKIIVEKLYQTYVENPLVAQNTFIKMPRETRSVPAFEDLRPLLPEPHWKGHEQAIACYWKVWELASKNLRQPTPRNGFVANYIDTAFNDCIFMWDSAFILMFGRYGSRAFDFLRTLDNFYAKQHPDGFICREIDQAEGADRFQRFDPAATGPNVMGWTEWEYYLNFGDKKRLAAVFPVLLAYHQWLRTYHTWRNGTYWSSGWGCGMDNQPRMPEHYHQGMSSGRMIWLDACAQQVLSANTLVAMANEIGRSAETRELVEESKTLTGFINDTLWDPAEAFYFDQWDDGSLNKVKSIGAYWTLLAGIVPRERRLPFIAHLEDPKTFNRPHRVPSLSADHAAYRSDGGYWKGGVWPPTNYMVLRGLTRCGRDKLAHEIARNHLENVYRVFRETGSVWENYAPEKPLPGNPARKDFVGWGGLAPTAVLLEYVFGLRPSVQKSELIWDVRLLDEHGVSRYPLGKNGTLMLRCAARGAVKDRPRIVATSTIPCTLEIRWPGGKERRVLGGGPT